LTYPRVEISDFEFPHLTWCKIKKHILFLNSQKNYFLVNTNKCNAVEEVHLLVPKSHIDEEKKKKKDAVKIVRFVPDVVDAIMSAVISLVEHAIPAQDSMILTMIVHINRDGRVGQDTPVDV